MIADSLNKDEARRGHSLVHMVGGPTSDRKFHRVLPQADVISGLKGMHEFAGTWTRPSTSNSTHLKYVNNMLTYRVEYVKIPSLSWPLKALSMSLF